MLTLPVPLIGALVLLFLLARLVLRGPRAPLVALLIGACAAQGAVIALAQHYGVPGLRTVQPITATLIPPAAWIACQGTSVRALRTGDAAHLAGPLAALASLAATPPVLNLLIPALFAGYGAALILRGARGGDGTPRASLAAGDVPGLVWQLIGAALIGSALTDVLIVLANAAGEPHLQAWIISVYSSAMLLAIGAFGLSPAVAETPAAPEEAPPPETTAAQDEIMERLDALMTHAAPHLDPDLTLARLARRLGVPAKQLSGAVNRSTGDNVSRYINAARVRAAQEAMRGGRSVTEAMLSSGFATKSNFNREFRRVTGMAPTGWKEVDGGRTRLSA